MFRRVLLTRYRQWMTQMYQQTKELSQKANSTSAPDLESNPYYSKYREKLEKAKLEGKITEPVNPPEPPKPKETISQLPKATNAPSKQPSKEILETVKNLSDVSEIEKAWKGYHITKSSICAVLAKEAYERIVHRSKDCPNFLYPVPRDNGYEFFLGQFLHHECYFTPLSQYKLHKEEAPPCLSVRHFPDLTANSEIVLMSGEYDSTAIGPTEAQCLVNQIQMYYASTELKKKLLLWNFNKEPNSFVFETVIEEFERSIADQPEAEKLKSSTAQS